MFSSIWSHARLCKAAHMDERSACPTNIYTSRISFDWSKHIEWRIVVPIEGLLQIRCFPALKSVQATIVMIKMRITAKVEEPREAKRSACYTFFHLGSRLVQSVFPDHRQDIPFQSQRQEPVNVTTTFHFSPTTSWIKGTTKHMLQRRLQKTDISFNPHCFLCESSGPN